ncbi:MAG: aromatic-ring-hydroxylating dioxygenase subunit beta [Reyranellaceae bacterium]
MPDAATPATSSTLALRLEVETFYYDEADLLDSRRFRDWLDLFTDDIHYWMPVRRTKISAQLDSEFSKIGDMAFFDDDKAMLTMRVHRLETGYAWAEEPPSRTRHLITNVRIVDVTAERITAESNFHLHRTRLNSDESNWLGLRRDVLRRESGTLRIARRHIFLEQTVLLSANLSNFF